ncbi:hypothetical protein [Niabella hirudinis]|uniref:hypothetical protein n=1 Tax=Niabella hirudinis TaxID=1285929 RepID=UPI003EBA106C
MDSQHKLYNHQVTPPVAAWNHIAAELEEWQALKSWARPLQALEAEPPAAAWNHIFEHLEGEQAFAPIAEKLRGLEAPPPPLAWDKIETELHATRSASKLHPVKKSVFNWSKYAVAACIAGLLGFSIFHLVEKSHKNSNNMISGLFEKKGPVAPPPMAHPIPDIKPAEKPHVETTGDLALNTPIKPQQIRTSSGNTYNTTVEKNKAIQGRYIMLMTEDGNVVRMSKKLGNMADCVAGENTSNDCNYQIEQWQKEMAKAPVAATPDNFLDILELARSENTDL